MTTKYCYATPQNTHIKWTELEFRYVREDDLYKLNCIKCGATETCTARRPSDAFIKCGGLYD